MAGASKCETRPAAARSTPHCIRYGLSSPQLQYRGPGIVPWQISVELRSGCLGRMKGRFPLPLEIQALASQGIHRSWGHSPQRLEPYPIVPTSRPLDGRWGTQRKRHWPRALRPVPPSIFEFRRPKIDDIQHSASGPRPQVPHTYTYSSPRGWPIHGALPQCLYSMLWYITCVYETGFPYLQKYSTTSIHRQRDDRAPRRHSPPPPWIFNQRD